MGVRRTVLAALGALVLGGCGAGAGPGGSATQAGEELFTAQGCGGCHTLAEAGSTGTVGPDLDQALADRDPAFIRESIVEPGARDAPGFPDNVMPRDYASRLSSEELARLVDYLAATAGR